MQLMQTAKTNNTTGSEYKKNACFQSWNSDLEYNSSDSYCVWNVWQYPVKRCFDG